MLGTENTFPITSHQSLNLLIFSKRSCHPLRQGDGRGAREEQVKIELVWAKIRTEYLFGQSQDAEVITYGQLITHDTIWYHHCLLAGNTNITIQKPPVMPAPEHRHCCCHREQLLKSPTCSSRLFWSYHMEEAEYLLSWSPESLSLLHISTKEH